MSFVDLTHARFDDQREVMKQIIRDGVCPFFPENLRRYHKQVIHSEGDYWILTDIQWPRENTRIHLLAIYRQHAESLSDISPEAGRELIQFLQWAEKHFGMKGGAFFLRFGDTSYSGATVKHLHVQLVVPDKEKPDFQPVRFKVG